MKCKKDLAHEVDSFGCIDCFYEQILKKWTKMRRKDELG